MVALVPDSGRFAEFESTLDPTRLDAILVALRPRNLVLSLPRFDFAFTLPLKETLATLGMPIAFSAEANFSGIDGTRRLVIQDVRHKAFISVDEAGTEAAAATAVVVGETSVPPAVKIDRPFVFIIRDIPTGTVLFLGRVVDPSSP